MTYDLADRRVSSTDANGLTVTYTYDAVGRVVTQTYPDATTAQMTYAANTGLLQSRTDRLGNTASYTYDAAGRVLTITDALSNVTTFTYNAAGHRASVTNALNQTTTFVYDQEGRLVTTTHPDSTTDTRAYTPTGLLASQTDRTGVTTSFTYDAMGRRTETKVAGNTVGSVTYDALGRTATQADARGNVVTMAYDSMGRIICRTMPDATHEDFTHGPNGLLTHTDRAGHATTYTYDGMGRRVSQTNPNGETSSYEYSLGGQMTKLTDARGNETQWAYDTHGRLTTKTYADGTTYHYTYDAMGRLLARTDGRGVTTSYTHGAQGRLLTVDYPDDPDITYTYDALGRKTSMTDASGTTTYTYDGTTGQLAEEDGPFTDDIVLTTWDAAGRRLSTAVTSDDRQQTTDVAAYTYDAQGRMSAVTAPPGAFTYSYNGASSVVTTFTGPAGLTVSKTYDSLNRLASVVNQCSAGIPDCVVSGYQYTYDNSNRRTQVDLATPGVDTVQWTNGRWEYTYDTAGQLTGGTRYAPQLAGGEGTMVDYSYTYDPMGNPTQRTEDSGVSAYTYNNLNQLATGDWSGTLSTFGSTQTANLDNIAVDGQAATTFEEGQWTAKNLTAPEGDTTLTVTRTATDQTTTQVQTTVTRPAATTAYTHDLNGNMQGDGPWTYTWNDENRMVSAEESPNVGGGSSRRLLFSYDGQGRRRTKRSHTWDPQTETWVLNTETTYTWDNWLIIREVTTDHTVAPATTQSRTHTRALDLSGSLEGAGGIGGLLSVSVSSPTTPDTRHSTLFLYDGNGNVTDLVDPITADPVAHYEYSPFGRTLIASGPLAEANPYRFSTKEQDATGLLYYGYRCYSPELGRWLARDPSERPWDSRIRAFARNNAVDGHDVLGLWPSVLTLDLPATSSKCALVNALLNAWAVGHNRTLLDHWRGGSGTTMPLAFWKFDSDGSSRQGALDDALKAAASLGVSAGCGKTVSGFHRLPEPTKTNRHNFFVSPMIYGWRFWYECSVSARKDCRGCVCDSILVRARCNFHARDVVNFWPSPTSVAWVPPYDIHDRLVRACNPRGRGFTVMGEASGSYGGYASCKGQYPWLPPPAPGL